MEDITYVSVLSASAGFLCGMMIGAVLAKSGSAGDHSYHATRIVSVYSSPAGTTLVRAVESPYYIDDQTVETIIDGKLVSRSKPADFEAIWSKAK